MIKAIKIVGGQAALAGAVSKIMGIDPPLTQQAVSRWLDKGCPYNRVLAVERATVEAGSDEFVSRHELDPDLYPQDEEAAA
ncbi:MAG: helix-turn-helix domain-containing protein [Gammaproteobacteria bacterium]|nr:helix-turn-helix domain-containing protein [Gammaproteobacteria bacterium]